MTLEDMAAGAQALPLAMIGGDKALARQIQARLGAVGLLDPPADGAFGPVSRWALREFVRNLGLNEQVLDDEIAQALLADNAPNMFPVHPSSTLAGAVAKAMLDSGHWICRVPEAVNIAYVEGMDVDGKANGNQRNAFNDVRMVIRIDMAGQPQMAGCWQATTEPGTYYTSVAPMNPRGAARIAFGQYKAWSVGMHGAGDRHEALVQTADITVFRDKNQDFRRDGDLAETGLFAIDQHWGYDMKQADIGNASAGCLVGRLRAGHREFMAMCKSDPRYVVNRSYRFMTAVLPAHAVLGKP